MVWVSALTMVIRWPPAGRATEPGLVVVAVVALVPAVALVLAAALLLLPVAGVLAVVLAVVGRVDVVADVADDEGVGSLCAGEVGPEALSCVVEFAAWSVPPLRPDPNPASQSTRASAAAAASPPATIGRYVRRPLRCPVMSSLPK